MRNRFIVATALVGVAALTLGACGSSDSNDAPDSTETADTAVDTTTGGDVSFDGVTLRVGEVKNSEFDWLSKTSDFFEDTPYKLEIILFESSVDMVEALSAGAVDVAPALGVPALLSAQGNADPAWTAEDTPFKIRAVWRNPQAPGWVILARDPAITDVAGLAGKKVVTNRGSFGQAYWLTRVEESGLTDVETVELPYLDALAAYREGSVDALITNLRNGKSFEAQGDGKIIDTSGSLIEYLSLSVMRSAVAEDATLLAAVDDLIARTADAYVWAGDNLDRVADYFMENMSLTPEIAQEIAPSELKEIVTDQAVITKMFDQVIAALVKAGIIPAPVDPSILLSLGS